MAPSDSVLTRARVPRDPDGVEEFRRAMIRWTCRMVDLNGPDRWIVEINESYLPTWTLFCEIDTHARIRRVDHGPASCIVLPLRRVEITSDVPGLAAALAAFVRGDRAATGARIVHDAGDAG